MGNFTSKDQDQEVITQEDTKIVEYVSMDDFTKAQIFQYIKTMKPKSLEIAEHVDEFKKINLDSINLITMCIELFEKASAILPEHVEDLDNKKSYKKLFFVKPAFDAAKATESINAGMITVGEVTLNFDNITITPATIQFKTDLITINEFNEAFRETNYKKDMMGISKKLLSNMTDLQKQRFINAFSKIYVDNSKTNMISLGKASYIYKESKKGPKDSVDSFRKVVTIPTAVNHFHRILNLRLSEYLGKNKYIDTTIQKGGISGMPQPMLQQIYKIKTIIKAAHKKRNTMAIMFLDISNAFGNLNLNALYQIMAKYNIDTQFITYLKNFYNSFEYYVHTKEWTTETFKWDNGLVQGCPMSPLLFVLALNYALKHVNNLYKDSHGYKINDSTNILLLAYIDDICLICKDKASLVEAYTKLEEQLQLLHLPINKAKSNIMFVNEVDEGENKVLPEFERVNITKYLGETISNDGTNMAAYRELLKIIGGRLTAIDNATTKDDQGKNSCRQST